MKGRREVALSLAIIAVIFFVRAGFAYWMQVHIVPIANMFADDYRFAERFPANVRFSIVFFGILELPAFDGMQGNHPESWDHLQVVGFQRLEESLLVFID